MGSSSLWTTAYVGWRLATSGYASAGIVRRAADWLEANELPTGGWGYNSFTGPDADSTALAILFLQAMGKASPDSAIERLLSFSRADGGFATYGLDQSFGEWTTSNVEVTATAALALRACGAHAREIASATGFVQRHRRPDGLWNSYWWPSPCYATEVSLRLLGKAAREQTRQALCAIQPANAFEAALRALALSPSPMYSRELQAKQSPDGGWPCAPILRLTHRDVHAPVTARDAGPCFADTRRIFTTATVLSAISIPDICPSSHELEARQAEVFQRPRAGPFGP